MAGREDGVAEREEVGPRHNAQVMHDYVREGWVCTMVIIQMIKIRSGGRRSREEVEDVVRSG